MFDPPRSQNIRWISTISVFQEKNDDKELVDVERITSRVISPG